MRKILLFCFVLVSSCVSAQEYRAYWVDTFNTFLRNHAEVVAVVDNARTSNANAIFAQVRRRGDAWYLRGTEPLTYATAVRPEPGFDPLDDLIAEAHQYGIEVHAFVIVGAIYNQHPTITGVPQPEHVFCEHAYDCNAKALLPHDQTWLTRSILPASGVTFDGYRNGSDFWIDLGHPDASRYNVDVMMELVNNYDIDGLHLDRIRYPDAPATITPARGANVGYNQTSLARFRRANGKVSDYMPTHYEEAWNQWRRDQVTNFVRRLYLNINAVKPHVKLSSANIAYGNGPTATRTYEVAAEAYWRVFQDWGAWLREGIIDIAMPMNYKREHNASQVTMFNEWTSWAKANQYNRGVIIGTANYLNGVEGTLRQIRRALTPLPDGKNAAGVVFFSMANTNVRFVTPPAPSGTEPGPNPFALPAPYNTPLRSFAEWASALLTGGSVDGLTRYEPAGLTPVFQFPTAIPTFPWKSAPQYGHLMGLITDESGAKADSATVTVTRLDDGTSPAGRTTWTVRADGDGFYGGVDLEPGRYQVSLVPVGGSAYTHQCSVAVTAGNVSQLNFQVDPSAPVLTAAADQTSLWPPDGRLVPITITGSTTEVGMGLDQITFSVTDDLGEVSPVIAAVDGQGLAESNWTRTVELPASRPGFARNGRTFTITITATDKACNQTTQTIYVSVAHDQRDKNN